MTPKAILELNEVCSVALKVFSDGENHLPVVTALNDAMSDSGYNDPCLTWRGLFHLDTDRGISMPESVIKYISPGIELRDGCWQLRDQRE